MIKGRTKAVRLLGCLLGIWLAGCGGGGGGDAGGGNSGGSSTPTTFNIGGTVSMAETAAVDSDTNDINQTGYLPNDTAATAQALQTPVLLVGSVNEPNTGPRGNNNNGTATLGDVDDWFRVDLVAGQVVELEFASDPTSADVDLYVVSADATLVGASEGTDTRFECVVVTQPTSYYVVVSAFRQASIYNLRIGAPGSAARCAQQTASLPFVKGELIAEPLRGGSAALEKATALVHAARARVASAGPGQPARLRSGAGPQLLQLPSTDAERRQGLRALAAHAAADGRGKAEAAAWPEAMATLRLAKRLRASGAFEYVEPNRYLQTTAITGTFPPNDRLYSYQRWHYEQINLPSAMERIVGLNLPASQTRPLVAVIDDGIVSDHPDLAPQLFSAGRAFISVNTEGDGDRTSAENLATAADQPVFHGTHVAGTVAAASFDGIGGAGTAPMAQILPLRVFPANGGARSLDVIAAMRYAAGLANRTGFVPTRRADVINLSLGSDNACDGAYRTAIADVRAAGTLVVAAAGNAGRNNAGVRAAVGSPANCEGAIAVSATDARRKLTNYSSTGTPVAVAAPGGDAAVSTTGSGAPDNVYSDIATFDASGKRQPAFGGMQGTSMAAPHVAGVMALMRYVNPQLSPALVDTLLASGTLTDDLGTTGRDIDHGFGLINARKAVDAALAALNAPPVPEPARVAALPSALDFGALQTSAEVEITASGATNESVSGMPQVVGAPAQAVGVTAAAVNAAGLGRYTVNVNRGALSGSGSFYPELRFTLNSGRVINVQLSILKPTPGNASARANFGPVYVLLIDPATGQVDSTVTATLANGRYSWSKTGYTRSRVSILAGGDLDNDDLICARGEPCGAFPVLGASADLAVTVLTGDRNDLNFEVSPLSGISPARAGQGAGPALGWRRGTARVIGGVARAAP
ncbi:MAG: S8 family serine peptidase [Rubrivivax sp.]|nr:S8 family serine peptidase [Rubrivivax sp.]